MNRFKYILLTVLLAIASHQAAAHSQKQACPATPSIGNAQDSVFRASAESGEWSGILPGKNPDSKTVIPFTQTLIIQDNKTGVAQFQYCTQKITGHEKPSEMGLNILTQKHLIITTTGAVWQDKTSSLGLTKITCEKTAPENCTFTIQIKD